MTGNEDMHVMFYFLRFFVIIKAKHFYVLSEKIGNRCLIV